MTTALRIMTCTVLSISLLAHAASAANPLSRLIKPGELIAGHAHLEDDCNACHTRFEPGSQSQQCRDCHEAIDTDMTAGTGFHGRSHDVRLSDCRECHTDHAGRDAQIVRLDPARFEHSLTDFPLLGAHSGGECDACHASGELFRDAPGQCVDCHVDDDRHHGGLGEDCAQCHTQRDFAQARYDHDATGWPLDGRHQDVRCADCHVDERYRDTPSDCIGCHRRDDAHHGRFGEDCATCHVAEDWGVSVFDHLASSGFALAGGHRNADCAACHQQPLYAATPPTTCAACHGRDDPHEGLHGSACQTCHVVAAWDDVRFDHETLSGYALLGEHALARCSGCHLQPADAVSPSRVCNDCHGDDDPHASGPGVACEHCHNERGWRVDVLFDHDLTAFPLLGRHAQPACEACHLSLAFADAPTACIDCHAQDDHHEGRLGRDCQTCHTSADWSAWDFDHAGATGYALTGAHRDAACSGCHRDGATGAPPTRCVACHAADDVHFGQFSERCDRCHVTDSFADIRQDLP